MRAPVRRRSLRQGRAWALAGSGLFHAGLVVLADRYLGDRSYPPPAPAISVQLVPLTPRAPPAGERPVPPRPITARQPRRVDATIAPTPTIPGPAGLAAPGTPSADALAGAVLDARGRRALRALAGCAPAALARLSPAERERCLERLAGAPLAGPGPKLNLDPKGRFAENPEPYLVRRPQDRCKPMATGDEGAHGDTQHYKTGILCAFRF